MGFGPYDKAMIRLDQALVERGLCDSREKAKRAVMAGTVKINGQLARKPSDSVNTSDELTLTQPEKFVSRGGHKLERAIEHFQLNIPGLTAIDLGASTGGFTDCLLQHGAARVFAVDVGQGQLAWKLRRDRRVVVMEKTNARELTPELFGIIAQRQNVSPLSSPKRGEGRGLSRRSVAKADEVVLRVQGEIQEFRLNADPYFQSHPNPSPNLLNGGGVLYYIMIYPRQKWSQ